jgi:exodeoxyribonuclease VIII
MTPEAEETMQELAEAIQPPVGNPDLDPLGELVGTHNRQAPEPGLYPGTPFNEYASWDAVNSHVLGALIRRTPAHVFYEIMHGGQEPTRSLDLGWMTHLATLEPERFAREFVVPPKVDRRTKEGKAAWLEFTMSHPNAYHAKYEDYHAALGMKASLLAHPTAGEFFRAQGINEVAMVWDDLDTGVRCKALLDRLAAVGEWPVIGDVKTARDASRRAFEGCLHGYGYGVQSVHYRDGLETLRPTPAGLPFPRFIFFTVESTAPYLVAPYELEEASAEIALEQRRKALKTWRQCRETGVWPGYHDGIELAAFPAWVFKGWSPEGVE